MKDSSSKNISKELNHISTKGKETDKQLEKDSSLHLVKSNNKLNVKEIYDYSKASNSNRNKNNIEYIIEPEFLLMTYFHPEREILIDDISKYPTLKMTEEKGKILIDNKTITMNCRGILEPKGRNIKDGLVIFSVNKNQPYDILLNINDNIELSDYKYIFALYFDKNTQQYYIRAHPNLQNIKKILYIKISGDNCIYLFTKEIIVFSGVLIEISSIDGYLKANFLTGTSNDDDPDKSSYIIHKDTCKVITIGRDPDCNIFIPDNFYLSRIQCTITYDEQMEEWCLKDGGNGKGSKNGTWLMGIHSFEIQNNLTVEIYSSKFFFNLNYSDQ